MLWFERPPAVETRSSSRFVWCPWRFSVTRVIFWVPTISKTFHLLPKASSLQLCLTVQRRTTCDRWPRSSSTDDYRAGSGPTFRFTTCVIITAGTRHEQLRTFLQASKQKQNNLKRVFSFWSYNALQWRPPPLSVSLKHGHSSLAATEF